jgi:hypothetical protein
LVGEKTPLTPEIIAANQDALFLIQDLEQLETEQLQTAMEQKLQALKVVYTEKDGTKERALEIDGKHYIFASTSALQALLEKEYAAYIQALENIDEAKKTALLNHVDNIHQEKVEVSAVETPVQTKSIEAIMQSGNIRIRELLHNTKLMASMQGRAKDKDLNPQGVDVVTALNNIEYVQKEFVNRFFGTMQLSKKNKNVLNTALSVHLFRSFGSDKKMRKSVFDKKSTESFLDIGVDNFLGPMKDWMKGVNPNALLQMSGMMQFFSVFKDPDLQEHLTGPGIRNVYLENPHALQQLMGKYHQQPYGKRGDWLKEKLKAGSDDFSDKGKHVSDERRALYDLSLTETKEMRDVVEKYGGSKKEFASFYNYIDNGKQLVGKANNIKQNILENPDAARIISGIATFR